ncbi:type IV secretion system protein VirB6 [Candidatus Xenohaliotis californiensis]|uniref:Type IV secretion system protein VirB6 n=1 Tax=Candidatus Xenohaliotis californiensis TaxID=84677 RepID=A0ABP0EXJ8_9RICK|nr:type IV secretion system protein VirB6 [Candidatus Xenohaliotis californiensis]
MKYGYLAKNIACCLLLLMLYGCSGPCTEADDVGQGYALNVRAKFTDIAEFNMLDDSENGYEPKYHQVLPWQETELITNGKPLVMELSGKWTSWNSTAKDRNCSNFRKVNIEGQECLEIIDDNPYVINDSGSGSSIKYGAPCWFEDGFGIYLLFFRNYAVYEKELMKIERNGGLSSAAKEQKKKELQMRYHPNATKARVQNPIDTTVHLYSPGKSRFWSGDTALKDSAGNEIQPQKGWKIFVKVISSYYPDNEVDNLKIKFMSGVQRGGGTELFSWLLNKINSLFSHYAEKTFSGIVKNPNYKSAVLASASLMIILTGFGYVIGSINISYADVVVRIIKIAVIASLLSPNSWDFFYQNFLILFTDGVRDLSGIIGSAIAEYDPDNPFSFIDYFFFTQFFSSTIWNMKIPAVIAAQPGVGIVWVLILLCIFVMLMIITINAVAIYLSGMMVISFLLGLTPIFLIALLFKPLKSIFDGWLSSLIHNALQIIVLMAFLIFVFDIVKTHVLKTVGFPTCSSTIISFAPCATGCDVSICCPDIGSITGHHPGDIFYPFILLSGSSAPKRQRVDANDQNRKIWYDRPYEIGSKMEVMAVPPYYDFKAKRYVNLPYLDPKDDADRIIEILNDGKIIDLNEASIVLLITILAIFMKDAVLEVGQLVGGGEIFRDNLSATFGNATRYLASFGGKYNPFQFALALKGSLQDSVARVARLDKIHSIVGTIASPAALFGAPKTRSAIDKAKSMEDKHSALSARISDSVFGKLEFFDKGIKRLTPKGLAEMATSPKKTMKELYNIGSSYKDHVDGLAFLRDKNVRGKLLNEALAKYDFQDKNITNEAARGALNINKSKEPISDDENIYDTIDDENIYDTIDDENIYDTIDKDDSKNIYENDIADATEQKNKALKDEYGKISNQQTKRSELDRKPQLPPRSRKKKSEILGTVDDEGSFNNDLEEDDKDKN